MYKSQMKIAMKCKSLQSLQFPGGRINVENVIEMKSESVTNP